VNARWILSQTLLAVVVVSSSAFADSPPVLSFTFGGTTQYAGVRMNGPRGIARGSGGDVYVSDTHNHRILRFSSMGSFLQAIPIPLFFPLPSGLDVDGAGNIFVACTARHEIIKLSTSGIHLATYGSSGTGQLQFSYPYAVVVDNSGFIYVGDKDNDRIQKLNADGSFYSEWNGASAGIGTFRPIYMKYSSTGLVYVTDGPGNRVLSFHTSGELEQEIAVSDGCPSVDGLFRSTTGIALDPTGDFFVSHPHLGCIQKFSSSGFSRSTWGSNGTAAGQFDSPNDIEVSQDGSLIYVVDSDNNRVQVFLQDAPVPTVPTSWSAIKTFHWGEN
jgi:DNA-binding beta-propeller fold protein YncE